MEDFSAGTSSDVGDVTVIIPSPAAPMQPQVVDWISPAISSNLTSPNLQDLPLDSNFAWLLCALLLAMTWIIYITYYNSRVVGFLLTKLINRFIGSGYLKIGSFSVSVLSGKVMFRDISYITVDYSLRVQDGWIKFRWWKKYIKRSVSEDLSHSDTRMSLLLNGLELHVYNRSSVYARLERLLGLDPQFFPPDTDSDDKKDGCGGGSSTQDVSGTSTTSVDELLEWRDLIPVIKVDISCGRVVFGNRLLPTSLLINVEEAHLVYTTKPASSRADQFMHIVKCKAENFKVILATSPRYTGMDDEPPRFMGEGFVVLQSNGVDLYFYMDEPGIVSDEPEMVELADGLIVHETTTPVWGLDIKCGKGTDFSYGPWADRQREHLFKFFFPQDYQPLVVTKIATAGQRRQFQSFDIRLSTLADATIDLLFSKNKETMAVHMNVKPGSYLEMTIPWIITEQGYSTRINGQLMRLDASTSLQYRTLAESETLEFDVRAKYPVIWNDQQQWVCNITGCKATANLIYAHKGFFQDLVADWSSKSKPDLLHFVPYSWHFNLVLKEFELILPSNQHNWIDCSSQHEENSYLAFCGELFDLSVDLPFVDFLPPILPIKIWIQGECVDLAMYLPEANTSRNIVHAIDNTCKLTRRDGSPQTKIENERKWRNKTKRSDGWIDCWSVPIVALSITYAYHPNPALASPQTDPDITTPEKEELLLNPIRPPTGLGRVGGGSHAYPAQRLRPHGFDPTALAPDAVSLELEVGPSVLRLYGPLLRNFMNVKENYFGADQAFNDLDTSGKSAATAKRGGETAFDEVAADAEFDPRQYRPLAVTVSITMHDIQAHLLRNCKEVDDPPCPSIYLERLGFEMHKTYMETRLQLLFSPVVLSVTDAVPRTQQHRHLRDGHLALSGLQVRGHAMFSDDGLGLEEETVEYAWLVEIQFGHFTGRLTAPQLHNIATCLETFVLLVEDAENALQSPHPYRLCHHGLGQPHCADTKPDLFCPTADDVKYRMTRLSVESLNLYLVEAGTALNILVYPIRFSTCNLHGNHIDSGHTAMVNNLHLRQFMVTGSTSVATSSLPSLPGGGALNAAHGTAPENDQPPADVWLEVGAVELGPVYLDSISASRHPDIHALQDAFLRAHDDRTLRLWFLWPLDRCPLPPALADSCGCRGACNFFGNNRYGHAVRSCEARSSRDAGPMPQPSTRPSQPTAGVDPGYGQSLLHEGQLIFDVLLPHGGNNGVSPNLETGRFAFTRGYMNQPTPMTSRDVSEHSLASVVVHPAAAIPIVAPMVAMPSPPPPVQRAFSHPERSAATAVECAAGSNSASVSMSSSSVTCFAAERTNGDTTVASTTPVLRKVVPPPSGGRYGGRATSVTSLQRVPSSPGGTVVESPTRERQPTSSSSSRQSLNGRPGGGGGGGAPSPRGSSFHHVRRTTSIGAESVQSLDVFYPAEDEPGADRALSPERRASNLETRRPELADGSCLSLLQTVIEIPQANSTDDKESNSASSTSFISALSSQEDLALVDLHVQLDKPIIDSPLLMFAYNAHMTRLTSSHWYELPPLPHYTHQSMERAKQQEYWGSQWIPHFYPLSEGFTGIKVVEMAEKVANGAAAPPPPRPPSPSHCPFPWDVPIKIRDELGADSDIAEEATSCDNNVSKTTMIVKLEGTVSVYISPLMLEATQHFVEAVTPALSSLHPSTITNHLHARCVSAVQDANQLKKDKYIYVSHLRDPRHRSTGSDGHPHAHHGQQQHQGAPVTSASHSGSVYEETHTSRLQVFVSVSKINVSILQASISEEMTSFSALDNLRDVTCVSLLILNLSQLSMRLLTSTQSRKSIQTLQVGGGGPASSAAAARRRRSKGSGGGGGGSKKSSSGGGGKTGADWFPPEPVAVETSETQQEELVATLDFRRIHTQLRRLPNSSSILREAALTAVPRHRSKVFFGYEQPSSVHATRPIPTTTGNASSAAAADAYLDAFGDPLAELEDRVGFIMFECGLEGFGLRAVKRAGFDVSSPASSRGGESGLLSSDEEVFPVGAAGSARHNNRPTSSMSANAQSPPSPPHPSMAKVPPQQQQQNDVPDGGAKMAASADKRDSLADASSCVIDFRTVWFNFAAPPHMPNTHKIDYTRLDWHLLSTATPAINSWLNPSNRLLVSVQNMVQAANLRQVSVLACLMAEALDAQELHLPVRGKYSRLTPLSKTLREDPSCQLLNVLQRYLNMSSLQSLEETLHGPLTPPLSTIHKGLIALGRQWKNVLYMPGLLERNIKMQQRNPRPPFNISFAVPLIESGHSSNGGATGGVGGGVTTEEEEDEDDDEDYDEVDASAEEATDEKQLLLRAGCGGGGSASTDASGSSSSNRAGSSLLGMELGGDDNNAHVHNRRRHATSGTTNATAATAAATTTATGKKKKRLPNFQPRSSCASVALPMLPGGSLDSYYRRSGQTTPVGHGAATPGPNHTATTKRVFLPDRNASNLTLRSAGPSLRSLDSNDRQRQRHRHHQHHHHHHHHRRGREDLYAWMSRRGTEGNADPLLPSAGDASRGDTLGSCDTRASGSAAFAGPPSSAFSLAPLAAQLADAHVLFHPLLTSLGVPSQIGSSSLGQRFGPNFSVRASLDLFKIDIVETEPRVGGGAAGGAASSATAAAGGSSATRQRVASQTRFYVSTDADTAAFMCERLSVEVDLREVQDLERAKTENGAGGAMGGSGAACGGNSGGGGGGQNLIYAKIDGFRKHNTVAINFCVNVHSVCQQVNLPLLRLLHQFSTMYQNARETQLELMEKRPHFRDRHSFRAHKKNDSSGSESQAGGQVTDATNTTAGAASSTNTTNTGGGGVGGGNNNSNPLAGDHHHPTTPTIASPGMLDTGGRAGSGVAPTVDTILRRPQTLTQRLRASTRGYTSISGGGGSGGGGSPLSSNISDAVVENENATRVASAAGMSEQTAVKTPRCWRTMYYLLDLYATMPETKTITNRSPVAPPDVSDGYKGNGKYEPLKEHRVDMEEPVAMRTRTFSHERLRHLRQSLTVKERVPLVVFGVVKVRCTRILATLSGLKLEAELGNLQASHTRKEKVQGSSKRWTETSATGYLGRATVVLLEGVLPNQQTIVKATVGKSQALYSGHSKRAKEKNSALITIGPINVDIPQHPVALHGMMTRSTKQLSSTFAELRTPRVPTRANVRASDEADVGSTRSPRPSVESTVMPSSSSAAASHNRSLRPPQPVPPPQQKLLHPIVVHFSVILDSLTIGASLLPSLRAQYQMGQVTSIGVTGNKAKFTVDLPKHSLSFTTKVQLSEVLPSSASVDLPPVHLAAEYVQQGVGGGGRGGEETVDLHFVDGAVLRKGSYLSAVADLGAFEHSLTTDLLNHLVFVQKVFMKEINEVVQKMSGGDKPVRLWSAEGKSSAPAELLYSVQLRLKGIQITATTPTNSAVRLETGMLQLQLSNRVQNLSGSAGTSSSSAAKLFGKAHVELNVSLGQLIRNALFEEAEPEFQQVAYFKTRIALRNALQDEMVSNTADDKEAVLITLYRPLIYILPVALDKAVIVWLNYKNAYEYWNEQRSSLNKEVLTATQQVLEKVPPISQLGSHGLSTLFLQLTINDMGICLPLSPYTSVFNISRATYDSEPRAACVVTLESTRISACSSGSLVSKGRFSGLCIRFADDFETSLDDWKPDPNDPNIMNLCVVSEGTYEICSRTVVQQALDNAKWILNVLWEMEGVAIHVDTNIGKQLSALAHTLTSLAGSQGGGEGDGDDGRDADVVGADPVRKGSALADGPYSFVLDPNMDAKKRSRLIEREMNEQAKIVNDLKLLGASHSTIEQETRILQELETAVFNDFRRDVIKRLRRQSMKASSIKEKFGILSRHSKPTLATPAPTPEKMVMKNICSPQGFSPSSSSQASSPSHGHARTTSLDSARVTFSSDNSVRHYGIDLSLGEKWPSADTMDPGQIYAPPLSTLTAGNVSHLQQHQSPSIASTPLTTTSESSPITTTTTPSELASDGEHGSIGVNSTPSPSETVEVDSQFERPSGLPLGSISSRQALLEPNIDFELDVKVFINSGKCVLHTKDFREEELRMQKGIGRERSFSSSTFDFPMSPGHRKRSGNVRSNASAAKLKFLPAPPTLTSDFTVFLIPGLDVKVHYNSRTECGESGAAPATSTTNTGVRFSFAEDQSTHDAHGIGPAASGRKTGMKRASLFAWMTLQSIPEETVITPHILDFLEKALEPIPLPLPQPKGHMKDNDAAAPATNSNESGFGESGVGETSSQAAPAAYASFPVDVVVYLRIQPSTLRFSCLPISRVECLLRLPSLDLVISTKRAEGEMSGEFRDPWPRTTPYGLADMYLTQAAVGGLSVTACLADFSVYIFHPYGGKKAGSQGSNKDLSGEASPMTGSSDRKDALSVQLEFVKVNLSRSRKVNLGDCFQTSSQSKPGRSVGAEQLGGAVIRFSTICDIGSASFKYDMRRLTEILAFPKAWYRRTIVRRLFLGDQSSTIFGSDQEDSGSSAGSSLSPSSVSSKGDVLFAFPALNLSDTNVVGGAASDAPAGTTSAAAATISTPALDALAATPRRDKQKQRLTLDLPRGGISKPGASASVPTSPMLDSRGLLSSSSQQQHTSSSSRHGGDSSAGGSRKSSILPTPLYSSKAGSTWETLVLFAVNLSKLNIHMNMGNVMGNTIWTTRGLQSQGRLSIGSSGHKNMFVSIGLGGSSLDAKGGIVGGTIELSQVDTYLHIKEDPGQEPEHRIGVKLFALESRLDYMGTSVFMGRVSSLDVTLRDEWRVHNLQTTPTEGDLPTKRPALIFIHGDLAWDQLQVMISKSTTPDLLKMHLKLEEFFAQQFHSSKRVLSSLQPSAPDGGSSNRRATLLSRKASSGAKAGAGAAGARATRQAQTPVIGKKKPPTGGGVGGGGATSGHGGEGTELRHHRHWQQILSKASGMKLPTLLSPLPKHGTILGGTMELHGNNISLACFHGINFRAKSWALFSLKEPNISFATEAQDVINMGSQNVDTHIVQNLSFTLGHNITEHTRHVSMATVCRISRNFVFPPQFRSMHEWFHYAFVTSELDEVDRFPGLERERRDSFSTQERQPRLSPKAQDCNHTMEMIFALPCLQLHLKTEHLQTETTPVQIDHKPLVECSFITEFEDHIFVAVDAEAFFFLHDLITAYIKEKDRVGTPAGHSSKSDKGVDAPAPDKDVKFKVSETTETLQKDWRNYECKTWHLEPTVRLMSWAGKRIEPYGVDYILQKLGFSHARVTIPKWMQRGAMDPLDKVLAVLMDKMVNALRDGGEAKAMAANSESGAAPK